MQYENQKNDNPKEVFLCHTQPTAKMIAEACHANICDYFRSNGEMNSTSKATAVCT